MCLSSLERESRFSLLVCSLKMGEANALTRLGLYRPAVTFVARLNHATVLSHDSESVTVQVNWPPEEVTFKRTTAQNPFSHFAFPAFYSSMHFATADSTFAFRSDIAAPLAPTAGR